MQISKGAEISIARMNDRFVDVSLYGPRAKVLKLTADELDTLGLGDVGAYLLDMGGVNNFVLVDTNANNQVNLSRLGTFDENDDYILTDSLTVETDPKMAQPLLREPLVLKRLAELTEVEKGFKE